MELDAGLLRHRVTWQIPVKGTSKTGQPTATTWAPQGTYWANVENLTGKEAVAASQLNASLTHVIFMRSVGGEIKPTHRLVMDPNGDIFNVNYSFRLENTNMGYKIYATQDMKLV